MADWRECRLGDLGVVTGGGTPSRAKAEYWDGDIPWITPGELTSNQKKYVSRTQDCISRLGLHASGAKLLPRGSLLVTSRASIGSSALTAIPMTTNQGFKNLIPNADVDPSFLFHLSQTLGREMTRRASGTTFLEVSGREFERIAVRLPSLEEQRSIAEILDTIDESIQATKRVIAKYEGVRDGLAFSLVGRSSGSDVHGEFGSSVVSATETLSTSEVCLRDCGVWLSGGTPDTGTARYWNGDIPWITSSSLKGRYLGTSDRRLTPAGVRSGSRIVPLDTILFVVRGMSLMNEFRVGIAIRQLAFGQDCKALVPAVGIDPKYLLFVLEAAETQVLRMVDQASHGTGRLQTSRLGSLRVHLPSLEEQRRVVDILDGADDSIGSNREHLRKLQQLRFGVAADLLSGRIRTVAA